MIAYLRGKVLTTTLETAILDVNGVGYEVYCSGAAFKKLAIGQVGELYTYLQVKEDGITLFGFADPKEKELFLKLITVSGVGPKMGISILAAMSGEEFARAIATADVKGLSKVKGLGKKTAEDHFFYFDVPNSGETKLEAVAGDLRDESIIRKVDKMNPDYILREQGAVLNWFDITEIEGRFSLNDKIGDVMKTFRGKLWFGGLFLTLAKKMRQNQPKAADKKAKKKTKNPEMNSGVMNMIGGFTVLRFTGMLGMRNVTFTKEELLKMNAQLNKIKKPKA